MTIYDFRAKASFSGLALCMTVITLGSACSSTPRESSEVSSDTLVSVSPKAWDDLVWCQGYCSDNGLVEAASVITGATRVVNGDRAGALATCKSQAAWAVYNTGKATGKHACAAPNSNNLAYFATASGELPAPRNTTFTLSPLAFGLVATGSLGCSLAGPEAVPICFVSGEELLGALGGAAAVGTYVAISQPDGAFNAVGEPVQLALTCPAPRLVRLEQLKDEACEKGRCDGKLTCSANKALRGHAVTCRDLRQRIIDECYGGIGDQPHRDKIEQVNNQIDRCTRVIQQQKKEGKC